MPSPDLSLSLSLSLCLSVSLCVCDSARVYGGGCHVRTYVRFNLNFRQVEKNSRPLHYIIVAKPHVRLAAGARSNEPRAMIRCPGLLVSKLCACTGRRRKGSSVQHWGSRANEMLTAKSSKHAAGRSSSCDRALEWQAQTQSLDPQVTTQSTLPRRPSVPRPISIGLNVRTPATEFCPAPKDLHF